MHTLHKTERCLKLPYLHSNNKKCCICLAKHKTATSKVHELRLACAACIAIEPDNWVEAVVFVVFCLWCFFSVMRRYRTKVSKWVGNSKNQVDWCGPGKWRYQLKTLLMRHWQLMILMEMMLERLWCWSWRLTRWPMRWPTWRLTSRLMIWWWI